MWNYSQPVKIIFGNGQVEERKNIMNIEGWENGLIVAAPNFISSGLTAKLIEESKGRLTAVFADFSPNPDVVEVDACAALIRKNGHGCVVALGGGSAMDLAKAAASYTAAKKLDYVSVLNYLRGGNRVFCREIGLVKVFDNAFFYPCGCSVLWSNTAYFPRFVILGFIE